MCRPRVLSDQGWELLAQISPADCNPGQKRQKLTGVEQRTTHALDLIYWPFYEGYEQLETFQREASYI